MDLRKENKDKLKVVVLANVPCWTLPGMEYLHEPGHYATWLEPLVPEFEEYTDLEIHWIAMSKKLEKPLVHGAYGQTFHILPRWRKALSMATGYCREVRSIRRIIKKIQPDVVHAWGSEDVYGLAGVFSSVKTRMFTLQGSLTNYLRLLGGGKLFRLQAMYEKPTVKRYRYGTAETPAAAELLKELNPEMEIKLVDYGVAPAFFEAQWNPAPEPIVVFLGAVTERKGIADLIRLAKSPALSGIRFKILGDGNLRESLERKSPSNVEWLGKCDRDEVVSQLRSAWCLLIPTYADTGPTVIKEARVVGLPIITTTGAGASCYVDHGKSGFVTAPGDAKAIESAVLSACCSRDGCIEMGQHGWLSLREQLSASATAQKLASQYRNLVASI